MEKKLEAGRVRLLSTINQWTDMIEISAQIECMYYGLPENQTTAVIGVSDTFK